ncbi:MAG: hypothetical protein ACREAX_01205 [Candidatus Nitrosotenuis sp.]
MTAARKIAEAENIFAKMRSLPDDEFRVILYDFVKIIHAVFLHLLEEYNLKFDCKLDRASLEKFKVKAKRMGKIEAINFLIWYEREYRRIRSEPMFGSMLERDGMLVQDISNRNDVLDACSALLNEVKTMTYHAYENF